MSVPVRRTDSDAILGHHEGRIKALERNGPDPKEWINVGSGAPAPPFQNGFSNVGGARVPMRYRFLRTIDPNASSVVNANAIEIQGAVTGGAAGLTIFQLLEPFYFPDGTPDWQPITRDFDVHLAASDDAGGFVVLTVLASGDVVYGFV